MARNVLHSARVMLLAAQINLKFSEYYNLY